MGTGKRPDRGLCVAVDVHYLSAGGARAAAVVAADAAFSRVLAEHTVVVAEVAAYRPGEFYRRELPPLRAVLAAIDGLGLLVIDGYADLDPAGRPGLGVYAHRVFAVPVTGVAKPAFRTATHAVPVLRGTSAVCHCRWDAPGRRRAAGAAHDWPVPATRRTAPRRPARPHGTAGTSAGKPPPWLISAEGSQMRALRGSADALGQ